MPIHRFHNPPTIGRPTGYTHVVEAASPGRIIYIAGQLGLDLDNRIVGAPGDFRAQAEQTFLNLKNALAAVGAGFEHVVKLNNYFIDIAHLGIFREVRDPTSTLRHRRPAPPLRSRISRGPAHCSRLRPWRWCPTRLRLARREGRLQLRPTRGLFLGSISAPPPSSRQNATSGWTSKTRSISDGVLRSVSSTSRIWERS
jgi:enamine deaminase RidA (YjgF/YER057c/UK114 family)